MANVTNKLQMTDGTICDIFEHALDMGGLIISNDRIDTRQNKNGIRARIADITGTISSTTEPNKPVFCHNIRFKHAEVSPSLSPYYTTPVSGLVRYGITDPDDVIPEFYIDIPGYTLEVFNNNDVIVRKNITNLPVLQMSIARGEVVGASKVDEIVECLRHGGTLTLYDTTSYFNLIPDAYMVNVPGGAPINSTIPDFINNPTPGAYIMFRYIYWGSGATVSKVEYNARVGYDTNSNWYVTAPT